MKFPRRRGKRLSWQAKQQRRLKRLGLCVRCWEPAEEGKCQCTACRLKQLTRIKNSEQYKATHQPREIWVRAVKLAGRDGWRTVLVSDRLPAIVPAIQRDHNDR